MISSKPTWADEKIFEILDVVVTVGRTEVTEMREVTIRKKLNGFEVSVGCQSLVFNDKSVMIAELSRYIDNPNQIEKEYLTKFAEGKEAYPLQGDGIRLNESNYPGIRDQVSCNVVPISSPAGSVGGGLYPSGGRY